VTSATPERASPGGKLVPVSPAPFVHAVVRPMTKVLNPLIVRLAGRTHFLMAAQIEHVGRRSGKVYVTPATAHIHGDVIVIALTFGNQSDWARNVRAAGGCLIRFNGRSYQGTDPQFLSRDDAEPVIRAAFGPLLRAGTRLLGVRQFLVLRVVPASS
jgi:deazaflavin-dependent oxidoreductase (nitroreductase family)